ncbi:hypothetical protein LMG31506_02648 [Cupriavidus yeoncheonensis]|uniref:Uncharacterized protein n=1 Tax=Cupriavidus yeoncheonensis TaxID=1462994 RepID=A0A916MXV5_9BURK|nr:hypothetical protein [Cupriavidus yeoncheonensis]CAG2142282.1 hypothetical protein LMG31506_02648 [Cupriavidus yeoncheonensis]
MSKTIKKQYLKALNRQLKKELAGSSDAAFVFYPLGAKPKHATGVAASGPADADVLQIMDAVQARVFASFGGSK